MEICHIIKGAYNLIFHWDNKTQQVIGGCYRKLTSLQGGLNSVRLGLLGLYC